MQPHFALLAFAVAGGLGQLVNRFGEIRIAGIEHVKANQPRRAGIGRERDERPIGIDRPALVIGHRNRIAQHIGQAIEKRAVALVRTKPHQPGTKSEQA